MKKCIILLLISCFLLTGCQKVKSDDIRDPMSVKKINWKEFQQKGSVDPHNIEKIVVFSGQTLIEIDSLNYQEFALIMTKNPKKIYTKYKKNTLKIYVRFQEDTYWDTFLNYGRDKYYQGKESTFYVDQSLLTELEKIKVKIDSSN